jgi:hypothetical protein
MFYNTPDFRDVVDAFIKGAPLADIPFVLDHLGVPNMLAALNGKATHVHVVNADNFASLAMANSSVGYHVAIVYQQMKKTVGRHHFAVAWQVNTKGEDSMRPPEKACSPF